MPSRLRLTVQIQVPKSHTEGCTGADSKRKAPDEPSTSTAKHAARPTLAATQVIKKARTELSQPADDGDSMSHGLNDTDEFFIDELGVATPLTDELMDLIEQRNLEYVAHPDNAGLKLMLKPTIAAKGDEERVLDPKTGLFMQVIAKSFYCSGCIGQPCRHGGGDGPGGKTALTMRNAYVTRKVSKGHLRFMTQCVQCYWEQLKSNSGDFLVKSAVRRANGLCLGSTSCTDPVLEDSVYCASHKASIAVNSARHDGLQGLFHNKSVKDFPTEQLFNETSLELRNYTLPPAYEPLRAAGIHRAVDCEFAAVPARFGLPQLLCTVAITDPLTDTLLFHCRADHGRTGQELLELYQPVFKGTTNQGQLLKSQIKTYFVRNNPIPIMTP